MNQTNKAHRQARLLDHMDLALAHIRDYAILLIDEEGRIAAWNDGAEQLLRYTATEALGRPIEILFTDEDRVAGVPARELETATALGQAKDDRWHQRRDGSRFFASGVLSAVRDDQDQLLGFVKIFRDLTERLQVDVDRERLLRQATESNRLKDEFLSTVSHELRTPLNAILGWIQLLRLRHADPASVTEGLAVIERNARAQARLIDDLLDVSFILTGKTRLALQPVALATPLGAAVETVRPMVERKRIALTVRHDCGRDALMADAERLQQVIWNVLTNAIKFTPTGGSIVVTTELSNDVIELCVQDSGIGIDPDFLPHVFDRFRQADTAYAKEHGGLGLGLSIVKHLVELHGGEVRVESDGRGHGTSVRLTIPRGLDVSQPVIDTRSAPDLTRADQALTGVNVLVVDDDADGGQMLQIALAGQGAQVARVASTPEALAAVSARSLDVVLADLSMPGDDGFTLLKQLRAGGRPRHRRPRVVAVTAHARPEDREKCLAAGFDDFVAKPVNLDQVIELVAGLAAARRDDTPSDLRAR